MFYILVFKTFYVIKNYSFTCLGISIDSDFEVSWLLYKKKFNLVANNILVRDRFFFFLVVVLLFIFLELVAVYTKKLKLINDMS